MRQLAADQVSRLGKFIHGMDSVDWIFAFIFCGMFGLLVGSIVGLPAEQRRAKAVCAKMLAESRNSHDSLLVLTSKPDSKYETCAERISR